MNEIELKNNIQSLEKDEIWEVVEECVDQLVYSNPVLIEQAYKNVAKETISTNYSCGSALKIIAQRIAKIPEEYVNVRYVICDNGLIYQTDIDANTGRRYIKNIYDFGDINENRLQHLDAIAFNASNYQRDIKTLKKMIKHCKNPMEKKSLEKELNEAYKRRKIK